LCFLFAFHARRESAFCSPHLNSNLGHKSEGHVFRRAASRFPKDPKAQTEVRALGSFALAFAFLFVIPEGNLRFVRTTPALTQATNRKGTASAMPQDSLKKEREPGL
jgi:hypothetical protein